LSHCVQASIKLAAAVDDDDAVAHLGLGSVARWLSEPQMPLNPRGQGVWQLQLAARGDEDPVRRVGDDAGLPIPRCSLGATTATASSRPRHTGRFRPHRLLCLFLEPGGRRQQTDGDDRGDGGWRARARGMS